MGKKLVIQKGITLMENQNLKEYILMEKSQEKQKNIMKMVHYNSKENIYIIIEEKENYM